MSVCDSHAAQLDPRDIAPPSLDAEDAWALAIVHDDRLPESKRLHLMWAALDARFGLPGDHQ